MQDFEVIVVGAGHAGIEAALAAARLGCRTALISGNLDTVGRLSCNPSIGGLGKSQLVAEIDALGGAMGLLADAAGIHWRTLGSSKGPAMWSSRAQCDKVAYHIAAKELVESQPGLFPIQGEVEDLSLSADAAIHGVVLRDGRFLAAPRVVLTTGTFLRGLLHQGETQLAGGRMGEHAVNGLSAALRRLGLELLRLKTGTPMRLHADTVDLAACLAQPGDDATRPFARGSARVANRIVCWSCHTNDAAHALIRSNLHRAPMYNGQISSTGPRYCPSIEDKVLRFAERDAHQLLLEPEGLRTRELYVNGLSTSLPIDIQAGVLAVIPQLAHAHVLRWGYAVEYDAISTAHLDHLLAIPSVPGLFAAGQINGSSGYEEAAAQGLLAGTNAALTLAGREPLRLGRADAYLGVLVDDLVRHVPREPYRMFTSRAEYRLELRCDTAERRLVPLAASCGLVPSKRAQVLAEEESLIEIAIAAIPVSLADSIAGEGLDLACSLALAPALAGLTPAVASRAWSQLRYAPYLARSRRQFERLRAARDRRLPDCDWLRVQVLGHEARQALDRHRPATLGEAASLPGINPADVETLHAWLGAGTMD